MFLVKLIAGIILLASAVLIFLFVESDISTVVVFILGGMGVYFLVTSKQDAL